MRASSGMAAICSAGGGARGAPCLCADEWPWGCSGERVLIHAPPNIVRVLLKPLELVVNARRPRAYLVRRCGGWAPARDWL